MEEIEEEVRRGRLRGKLNELWAVVGALMNGAKSTREASSGGGTEWAVVDEEGLSQIAQVRLPHSLVKIILTFWDTPSDSY